jgi:spore coat polysaccharide biosynthesis protein SpsF
MKIVAIVQARMGSTRLPGKIMMYLQDQTVLGHVIQRLQAVESIHQIIIATTNQQADSLIVEEAGKYNVDSYRGSEQDVLLRYYEAAVQSNADIIVRITSDCPLIDPDLVEKVIQLYLTNASEYARLDLGTFPRGLDVEVISMKALRDSHLKVINQDHREHVTLYVYEHPEVFGKLAYACDEDFSQYRFTLDTPEDLKLISEIFAALYHKGYIFGYKEIINLLHQNPNLIKINAKVEQKNKTR